MSLSKRDKIAVAAEQPSSPFNLSSSSVIAKELDSAARALNISDVLFNCDRLERGAVGDKNRAILDDQPTGALPAFQRAIDAAACASGHQPEIGLRNHW